MLRKLRKRISGWLDPIKPRLRPANVCLFHPSRVGSSVLGDMLNQHPTVCWVGEIYWEVLEDFKRHTGPEKFRSDVDPHRVMRDTMRHAGMSIFGGEVRFDHLDLLGVELGAFLRMIDRMHFGHFVILKRRNHLRRLVSGLRVINDGQRWKQPADECSVLRPVRVDMQAAPYLRRPIGMFDLFDKIDQQYADAEQALVGRRVLHLTYEDDIERDPRVGYQRTCDFLGIEAVEVAIRLGRMNPFPLRDMIENYEEIAEALRGTRYAWMLEA